MKTLLSVFFVLLFHEVSTAQQWLKSNTTKISGLTFCLHPGAEYGLFFKNTEKRSGTIRRVRVLLEQAEFSYFLRFYQTNADGKPIAALLKDEIQVEVGQNGDIDVSDKKISVPANGFLVSVRAPTTNEFRYKTHKTTRTLAYGSQEKTTDFDRMCLEASADDAETCTWHRFPNRAWALQTTTYAQDTRPKKYPLNVMISTEIVWQ